MAANAQNSVRFSTSQAVQPLEVYVSVATAIKAAVKSGLTLVTSSGVTFTALTDGTLVGGVAPLGKRLVTRIVAGTLLVTTPHQAGGAYMERGAGGVYAAIKTSAKLRTLSQQISLDPRLSPEERIDIWAAISAKYAQ